MLYLVIVVCAPPSVERMGMHTFHALPLTWTHLQRDEWTAANVGHPQRKQLVERLMDMWEPDLRGTPADALAHPWLL